MTTLDHIKGFPYTFLIWYHEGRSNRDHGRAVATERVKQDEQRTASQAVQGAEQCAPESAAEEAVGLGVRTTERNSSSRSSYSKRGR